MNKSDFVNGLPVREPGTVQVMTLGGSIEDWIGQWHENGQPRSAHFKPEQLERVPSMSGA